MNAETFLLKKLNPKSGTLKTGVMNNDYAAELMEEYARLYLYTHDEMIDFARFVWYNKDLKDTSVGIADFFLEWEEKRNKAPGKP